MKDGKPSSASRGSQKALSLDIKNKEGGMDKNEDRERKIMRFGPKVCNKRRHLFYLKYLFLSFLLIIQAFVMKTRLSRFLFY